MKLRNWMTIITLFLLAIVVYSGYDQIVEAWGLLGSVDIWVYFLIFPLQFLSYYAVGEVLFSYLRAKGELKNMSRWRMARIALELNFVDHIVPVPSVAGVSYLGWILKHDDVKISRSTMAQILRYVIKFTTFIFIMLISVVILIFDNHINKLTILACGALLLITIIGVALFIYCISNYKRIVKFSDWFTRFCNKLVRIITFGKKRGSIRRKLIEKFFVEMHQDYLEIIQDKRILIKPLLWGIAENLLDVFLILIAFLALGFWVNPAVLFIASGISSSIAIFFATPGGAGAYETVMIAFLISTGVPAEIAIAGTLLARATLFAATIFFGYVFYQMSVNKYGRFKN